jgi:hypothetical protein
MLSAQSDVVPRAFAVICPRLVVRPHRAAPEACPERVISLECVVGNIVLVLIGI